MVLQKLETELRLRGFSEKTVKNYIFYNQKFLDFINKQPEDIQEDDIKSFIAHLMSDKNYKPASTNLAICSLRYFYEKVLEKEIFTKITPPKSEKKIPTVLTKEELSQLFNAINNKKHRILLELMYSSGLRVSEAVSLKFEDLNLNEKVGIVRQAKGRKDRIIILSNNTVDKLEKYKKKRDKKKLFPDNPYIFPSNKQKESHMSIRQAQKVINDAAKKAGIKKRVFCHSLRSSFATHLLDSGTDIRVIQELLGHSNLSTTERYTKVSTEQLKKVRSPFDNIKF
ncbi:tyrosine-type recombinase/integrase [Candidatus Woesearchaeota archaeon]|nr:tyrosine-type recombinase/integrase [Candidatus Woesearchaeota archaeon]